MSDEVTSAYGSTTAEAHRIEALRNQDECQAKLAAGEEMPGWQESRNRIYALRERMKRDFVDRDEAVDAIIAALISRTGCVLLGPPGTAKSLLVSRIARECRLRTGTADANYFEYLLTAHTMPEEVFGPTEIELLLKDPPQVKRRTAARLPHAELAFLDEVFRGGSHILNTLLTILNERRFYNGEVVEKVPLVGFIGAANHPPQTEELQAFFDRFPVRVWVNSVLKDEAKRRAHARALIAADAGSDRNTQLGNQAPSMFDFRKLWSILRLKLRPDPQAPANAESPRLEEFTRNFISFQSRGRLSDRSFVQLWYFAGALDMVAGLDPDRSYQQGGRGHFKCFGYIAPDQKSEADIRHHLKSRLAAMEVNGA